jgi:hypothetical protein
MRRESRGKPHHPEDMVQTSSAVTHPWNDSCKVNTIERFLSVFVSPAFNVRLPKKLMLPVYSALHIIPSLVLRWNKFRGTPVTTALRLLVGIGRSCSFLGVFVCIFQGMLLEEESKVSAHPI